MCLYASSPSSFVPRENASSLGPMADVCPYWGLSSSFARGLRCLLGLSVSVFGLVVVFCKRSVLYFEHLLGDAHVQSYRLVVYRYLCVGIYFSRGIYIICRNLFCVFCACVGRCGCSIL